MLLLVIAAGLRVMCHRKSNHVTAILFDLKDFNKKRLWKTFVEALTCKSQLSKGNVPRYSWTNPRPIDQSIFPISQQSVQISTNKKKNKKLNMKLLKLIMYVKQIMTHTLKLSLSIFLLCFSMTFVFCKLLLKHSHNKWKDTGLKIVYK